MVTPKIPTLTWRRRPSLRFAGKPSLAKAERNPFMIFNKYSVQMHYNLKLTTENLRSYCGVSRQMNMGHHEVYRKLSHSKNYRIFKESCRWMDATIDRCTVHTLFCDILCLPFGGTQTVFDYWRASYTYKNCFNSCKLSQQLMTAHLSGSCKEYAIQNLSTCISSITQ